MELVKCAVVRGDNVTDDDGMYAKLLLSCSSCTSFSAESGSLRWVAAFAFVSWKHKDVLIFGQVSQCPFFLRCEMIFGGIQTFVAIFPMVFVCALATSLSFALARPTTATIRALMWALGKLPGVGAKFSLRLGCVR